MRIYEPELSLTVEQSDDHVDFLDITIFKDFENNCLATKTFQKQFATFAYVHFRSNHTLAMKKGIIFSQLLSYAMHCSRRSDYDSMKIKLYKRMNRRSYSNAFIRICEKPSYNKRLFYIEKIIKNLRIKQITAIHFLFQNFEICVLADDILRDEHFNLQLNYVFTSEVDEYRQKSENTKTIYVKLKHESLFNHFNLNFYLKKMSKMFPSEYEELNLVVCNTINRKILSFLQWLSVGFSFSEISHSFFIFHLLFLKFFHF